MVEKRNVDMVYRQRGKRHLAKVERWSTDALERIGTKCHLISNATSMQDWEIFLRHIYEAVLTLTNLQRTILLLSQEFGIPRREIARIVNMDASIVHAQYNRAVALVCGYMKERSLLKPISPINELTPHEVRMYGGKDVINSITNPEPVDRVNDERLSNEWKSARGELVEGNKRPNAQKRAAHPRRYIYYTKAVVGT